MTQDYPDWTPVGYTLSDLITLINQQTQFSMNFVGLLAGVPSAPISFVYAANIQPYIHHVEAVVNSGTPPPAVDYFKIEYQLPAFGIVLFVATFDRWSGNVDINAPYPLNAGGQINAVCTYYGGAAGPINIDANTYLLLRAI